MNKTSIKAHHIYDEIKRMKPCLLSKTTFMKKYRAGHSTVSEAFTLAISTGYIKTKGASYYRNNHKQQGEFAEVEKHLDLPLVEKTSEVMELRAEVKRLTECNENQVIMVKNANANENKMRGMYNKVGDKSNQLYSELKKAKADLERSQLRLHKLTEESGSKSSAQVIANYIEDMTLIGLKAMENLK